MHHIFQSIPEIELVYQFGSSVRPSRRKPHDVDIALLFNTAPGPERRLEIHTLLSEKLAKYFHQSVDIAFLNGASPVFVHQVLKKGRLLYGDPQRARDFMVQALTRYFDYAQFHRFFTDRLKQRLGVKPHG